MFEQHHLFYGKEREPCPNRAAGHPSASERAERILLPRMSEVSTITNLVGILH